MRDLLTRLDAQLTLVVIAGLVGLLFPPFLSLALLALLVLILLELRRIRAQMLFMDRGDDEGSRRGP